MWSVLKLYLYLSCKNIKDNENKKSGELRVLESMYLGFYIL